MTVIDLQGEDGTLVAEFATGTSRRRAQEPWK